MAADPASIITAAYPRMGAYASDLVATAKSVSIDPAWLANIIQLESGGNPQAVNPTSGATGLIQFMPTTALGLGTTVGALMQLDGNGQMPYVRKYFEGVIAAHGPLRSQEDVIAAVFFPAFIGKPFAQMSAIVQQQNAGITTVRDYTNRLLSKAKLPAEGIGYGSSVKVGLLVVGGSLAVGAALLYVYRPEFYTKAYWTRK